MRYAFLLLLTSMSLAQTINPNQIRPGGVSGGVLTTTTANAAPGWSTNVNVGSVNEVLNPLFFTGSDIGAQVNAAIAALHNGCGTVMIPAGTYVQTTTIIKPRCVNLQGAGGLPATQLTWTPGTVPSGKLAPAILIGDQAGVNNYPPGVISGITLTGASTTQTVGIFFGGDPAGTSYSASTVAIFQGGSVCTATGTPSGCPTIPFSPNNYADMQAVNASQIASFGYGVTWGSNAWDTSFLQDVITTNTTGVYYPSNATNSGESLSFISTAIQNNGLGVNQQYNSEMYFVNDRFDYNSQAAILGLATIIGCHFEAQSGNFITEQANFQPYVTIIGGLMLLQATSGTDTDLIYVNSTLNPLLSISGTAFASNHTVNYAINWNGSGGNPVLHVDPVPYYAAAHISALTNASCTFYGCSLNDGQGTWTYGSQATFGSLATQQTPTSSSTLSNFSVPIVLNGTTYYIRLSSAP